MFRICITIVAYIMSYVSHSNELQQEEPLQQFSNAGNEVVDIVLPSADSLKVKEEINWADLK